MSSHVRHRLASGLSILLALAPFAHAGDARRLGAPSVMKLDWGVSSVRAADIDGDGHTDLALLNNETGRIETLLRLKPGEKAPSPKTLREDRWAPVTDDAPFRRLSLTGSADMGSLALADLDGSGRIRIAYTSSRDGLTVVSRDKDGEWTVRKSFTRFDPAPGQGALTAADLDGSGRKRLVMLSKSGVLVFPAFAADGEIPEPRVYRIATDSPSNADVADLDGDGAPDITYLVRGDKPELHVRFGLKGGGFGPERAFATDYWSIDFSRRIAGGFPGVSYRKRTAEIFNVTRDTAPFAKADTVSPALYSPASPLRGASLVSLLSGDGKEPDMMVVADPKGAAVQLYRREKNGDFGEPAPFPAPANLTAVATGRFNGAHPALLTIGDKDGVLGFAQLDDKGRPPFPAPVKLDGTPVAMTTDNGGASGAARALVVVKKDRKASLVLLAGDGDKGLKIVSTSALDASATDAECVLSTPLGVVVTCGRSPALMLKASADKPESFVEIAKDSAVRKTMLSGVGPSELGCGDTDGDGKPELLVAAPGYIRALTLDDKGELVVKDQFNTRRPGDKPRCPFVATLPGEKSPGVFFYNDTDKGIEWLAPDDKGVFRHRRTILTGAVDPQQFAGASGSRRLFAGRDIVSEINLAETGPKLAVTERFETDLPGIIHMQVASGNFTGGKTSDLVLIDPRAHLLELASRDDAGAWKSSMNFRLFDDNPFYRGRRSAGFEPHDGLVSDLDGDGFDDLVLLMHDRLLVYPSEKK